MYCNTVPPCLTPETFSPKSDRLDFCGCRFLVRLLLVHGTLSNYRLARLIKYSFFKNVLFCFMLFFFQARISPQSGTSACLGQFSASACFCLLLPTSCVM